MKKRMLAVFALLAVTLAAAGYALLTVSSEIPEVREREAVRILIINNPPALDEVGENFRARMQELGYAPGARAEYVEMDVGSDTAETKTRIGEAFAQGEPDLIFSTGVIATRAAKEFTEENQLATPIVFGVVSDPVGGNLVQSLRSSGNNLTGITPASNVTASKRVEFLQEIQPSTKRIVIVWNDEKTSGIAKLRTVVETLGLKMVEKKAANVQEMSAYLLDFDYEPGDAILRSADGVAAGALPAAIEAGLKNDVAVVGTNSGDTKRGALMSFGADYADIGRASARLADLILHGARPADIPIEEASRFEVSVNLRTAKEIGVVIPQYFLLKANVVVPEE